MIEFECKPDSNMISSEKNIEEGPIVNTRSSGRTIEQSGMVVTQSKISGGSS